MPVGSNPETYPFGSNLEQVTELFCILASTLVKVEKSNTFLIGVSMNIKLVTIYKGLRMCGAYSRYCVRYHF